MALLPGVRAFAIPMRIRFRGVTVREGALIEGPAGLGGVLAVRRLRPARVRALAGVRAGGGVRRAGRSRSGTGSAVNVIVPAVGPERAREIVAGSGCRTAKVKVADAGQGQADDIARVAAVRDAIGPDGRIRVDVNGAWTVGAGARRMLAALAPVGLEYVEQPCATLARAGRAAAADRSAAGRRRVDPPRRGPAGGAGGRGGRRRRAQGRSRWAASGPCCGWRPSCGLPVVVSSAMESSVGLAAGVALAAALPELRYDCGLATMSLLTGDVTADPLVAEEGTLPLRAPVADPERLSAWESDPAPWRVADGGGRRVPRHLVIKTVVNPSTAFGTVLADELARCGLREAVLAPGSRSTPLALALAAQAGVSDLRLHVRIDERSAAFLALGLAKASRRPVAVVCTSGTAAAHFHPAVIEADESGVPLIVLTADRPPELRGTGANQTIDQVKLYGGAVRWFCETGVPEAQPGMAGYWRSLACRAWAAASGSVGGFPGPVHLNVPLRDPLVPDPGGDPWPDPLDGRPGGAPWTSFGEPPGGEPVRVEWAERGVVICGDGDYDAGPLLELAEAAGWPVLAEPSSGARQGQNALSAYSYLLDAPGFAAAHRPDVIVSAGRPGLSRGQLAFLRGAPGPPPARHVVVAQGPGRWADPARTATCVAASVRLAGPAPGCCGDGGLARVLAAG